MLKQSLIAVLLIVLIVSCAPANQPERLPTAISTIMPVSASTLIASPTATTKFLLTPTELQTPSTLGDEPTLVFFVSEQGRFEAWMPVSESILEYTVTQLFFKKSIECSITVSRLNGAGATVQYCDLDSEDIATLSSNAVLAEARELMKKDFRLKVDKEQTEVVNGSYPALTLSGVENMRGLGYDGTFKARIILVKNRVYFVHMSVYSDNWCNCVHQMDQVVDSFYIEPEMSIPFEPTP